MKLKKNLKLRRMGGQYMIVDASGCEVNLTRVFTLNETAAFLWKQAEGRSFEPQDLADALCKEYAVEPEQALNDVTRMLAAWERQGLVVKAI